MLCHVISSLLSLPFAAAVALLRHIVFRHELMDFQKVKKATKAQTIRSNTQRSITAATTTATPNSRLTCLPIFFFVSVSCNLRIGKYRVCHSLNSGLSDFVCLLFFLPSLSTRLQSHAHCLKIVSSFLKLLA